MNGCFKYEINYYCKKGVAKLTLTVLIQVNFLLLDLEQIRR